MRTTGTMAFARFDAYLRLSRIIPKTQEHQQRRKYPARKGKDIPADTDGLRLATQRLDTAGLFN